MDAVDPSVVEEEFLAEEEDAPYVRLKEGIQLKEFIDSSSAVFQVNVDDFPEEEEEEDQRLTYFNKEELLKCSNYECLDGDDDDDDAEPGRTPFERMASKMTAITDDGKLKKRVVQAGHGSVVPDGAYVTLHYNAYVEYGDDPYDSSWLRGQPQKFKIGESSVIPALEIAAKTMKKGEISKFLSHPDLGYGRFGCPPRIPPNAELLHEIELLNYFDNTAAEALENLSIEDRQKQEFKTILEAAQQLHLLGNEAFKHHQTHVAISKYKKAISILEKCHLKDEDEEKQQQSTLLKLYINLALCYNKRNMPKLACVMCRHALEIEPKSAKALFTFGRALLMLSDYKEAQRRLLAARKLEPNDKSITEELKKLEKKKASYNSEAKIFAERAFKTKTVVKEEKETKMAEVTADFEEAVQDFITQFKEDGKGHFPLPTGLTFQEEFYIQQKAEENGLIVRCHEQKGERQMYVCKADQ